MKNERMISVKPLVLEKALRDAGLIRFETDSHVVELRALLDTPAPCAHEWTDDGGHLIVCTACGSQEDHDPGWRDMQNAPKDGTMLRLLVSFDEHSTEDADEAPTIGANNFDNDGEDAWRFAGWCWTHDHFTQGVGTPVGWLPMIDASASTAKLDRLTAERDALQLRLNAADQRIDELTALPPAEAPAFELQEPVAPWFYFVECDDPDYSGLFNHESEAQTQANDHGGQVIKLWNVPPTWRPEDQPAPVAVVLPERKKWDGLRATACNLKGEAWNDCLDEVARLNQITQ